MSYQAVHKNLRHALQKARRIGQSHEEGAAYLMLMFAVLIMGIGLVAVSNVWHTTLMRDKEQELLFYGNQFRQAIGQYYANTPGRAQRYPAKLEDLLKDPRFPGTKRYLRKIFIDPMTGEKKWGLLRNPSKGIIGVHSMSDEQPIKKTNFKSADKYFEGMSKYSAWVFIYKGGRGAVLPPGRKINP